MKSNNLLFIAFGTILLLGVLHAVASVSYLYWTTGWFDTFMHFLGGLSLGLLILWVIYRRLSRPKTGRAMLLALIAVLIIGVGWEVFEYLNGITQSTEAYPLDVRNDLIADLIGGALAGFVATRRYFYNG